MRIDPEGRRAWFKEEELQLTAKEFDLLRVLVREQGKVVSREQLMREIWETAWFGSTKTLDMHISVLRRKLGDDAAQPRYIATVRGVGFRFERGEASLTDAPAADPSTVLAVGLAVAITLVPVGLGIWRATATREGLLRAWVAEGSPASTSCSSSPCSRRWACSPGGGRPRGDPGARQLSRRARRHGGAARRRRVADPATRSGIAELDQVSQVLPRSAQT